ncbi:MAG: twin-arginine translocase subunit TatC [Acidimicrobiia bacterium]
MTVLEHLGEFRRRIIICIVAVAITATIAFVFSNLILHWFLHFYREAVHDPKRKFIFTGPLDAFIVRIKVATYGGIVLASPIWLYELWRFVTPGLNPKEKRFAVPFLASSVVLFVLGGFVAILTLQPALGFLFGVGGNTQEALLTADKYVGLVSLMILAFGISFEFPIVLMFLLLARVIHTDQLRRFRRGAVLGITIFAAVITPSQDPYSLFFMAAPMYLFYEVVIVIGRILKR